MSKLQQIEASVLELSTIEQQELREWLDNLLENQLKLRDEFRTEIEDGIKDIKEGRYRVRKP